MHTNTNDDFLYRWSDGKQTHTNQDVNMTLSKFCDLLMDVCDKSCLSGPCLSVPCLP